jgi:hypothetical protein
MMLYVGEATAALLAVRLASSCGFDSLFLGDAFIVIFAVNSPSLFLVWNFGSILSDMIFSLFIYLFL